MIGPTCVVSVPLVDSEQAALLMAHHISLAVAYFEATAIDVDMLKALIGSTLNGNELAAQASVMWLEMIDALYDREDRGIQS